MHKNRRCAVLVSGRVLRDQNNLQKIKFGRKKKFEKRFFLKLRNQDDSRLCSTVPVVSCRLPQHRPPPAMVLFCSFSHLSQQTPLLFITASALREPPVNPWHHTGPISKGMKIQTALCHQFSAAPLLTLPPTHLSGSPSNLFAHHRHHPLFHLPRQAVQSSAAAPTWISLSSPSGNVCWSFRVSCQTGGWGKGGGAMARQRLSRRSRREERGTSSVGEAGGWGGTRHVTGLPRTHSGAVSLLPFSEDTRL